MSIAGLPFSSYPQATFNLPLIALRLVDVVIWLAEYLKTFFATISERELFSSKWRILACRNLTCVSRSMPERFHVRETKKVRVTHYRY